MVTAFAAFATLSLTLTLSVSGDDSVISSDNDKTAQTSLLPKIPVKLSRASTHTPRPTPQQQKKGQTPKGLTHKLYSITRLLILLKQVANLGK